MKSYRYISIALMALLLMMTAACTKAELCNDAEHPHRAGVRFDYDWATNVTSDVKATHQLPDSMLVIVKRIIGTELTGCRVSATDGKGYYLFNGPIPIPAADPATTGDDTGDNTGTDNTGNDDNTGGNDDTGGSDNTGGNDNTGDNTGSDAGGGSPADNSGNAGNTDNTDNTPARAGDTDTDPDGDTDTDTDNTPPAAPIPDVPGYNAPTDLFKVRPGMFKCITVNRDTTEFDYKEIIEYVETGWPETTLRELCVEYKRYGYRSPKLRNPIPGWSDYNIYGNPDEDGYPAADNYLQPDMTPVYYDSISPVTISRNVEQEFTFHPILLTQNIDIRFHIRKKVDVAPFAIDAVYADISGIPYRLNLSTDLFDIRNTAKMQFTCQLEDANGNKITDSNTNEYLLCHGNIDVLSLVNAPNPDVTRGPGIMQLMITLRGTNKPIRLRINLFHAIERANLYKADNDGAWAHRRKAYGTLEIDTGLVIDEKAVITNDEEGGLDKWIVVGQEDDIVVDA